MSTPYISIVIPTLNVARILPRCLESIAAQTFRDFEVLAVDGGSTDGTFEIFRAKGDNVTYLVSEPDRGVYHARNKALAHATGEWVCFLGADDWFWSPDALATLVPHLRTAWPRFRVVYSRLRMIDRQGQLVEEVGEPWVRARAGFFSFGLIPHPGLMHHRTFFESHGVFDERFKISGDCELLLRELKTADALFAPELTVGMEFGGESTRPENFLRVMRETEEALTRHGYAPPRLLWTYWKICSWLYVRLHALVGDRIARRLADAYRLLSLRKPRFSGHRD